MFSCFPCVWRLGTGLLIPAEIYFLETLIGSWIWMKILFNQKQLTR